MRKTAFFPLLILLLLLPLSALAGTVSGTYTQISNKSEKPVQGITVVLEGEDGVNYQATTDKSGNYRFNSVKNGSYHILITLPGGQVPAEFSEKNWLLPVQAGRGNVKAETPWFTVSGDQKLDVDLASTGKTVYFTVIAFVDENANGGRMKSEPLLKNVQVDALAWNGSEYFVVASDITGRNGEASLRSLSPGTYRIAVTLPENYMIGPKGIKDNTYYNCINPSDTGYATSDDYVLTSGSLGLGVGVVAAGSARGTVWYDADHNGSRDAGESGFTGAIVELISDELQVTRRAAVQADGSFVFSMLQPTDYTYRVTLPDGYMFTSGSESLFTDGYSSSQSATVHISAESTTTLQPVGVMDATSLSVRFYLDQNANGVRDENEPAFANGRIEAYVNGAAVASASTDETGVARIPVLRDGDVTVTAFTGEGTLFSVPGAQNSFGATMSQTEVSLSLTLPAAQATELDAAVTLPASIQGIFYMDADNNGVQNAGEAGAAGFTVEAVNESGTILATATADESGAYRLDHLLPGVYTVRFLLQDPFIASPYAPQSGAVSNMIVRQTGDFGETEAIRLTPGARVDGINGGLFQAGTAEGSVLLAGDLPAGMSRGLSGVKVTLIAENGEPYSDYTYDLTDENGAFYIKGILPGVYTLRYELPDDALFEESDALTAVSTPFETGMGSQVRLADVMAVRTATVAGVALADGEPAHVVLRAENTQTGRVYTAEGSEFALKLLRPGEYRITAELPGGYGFAEDTDLVAPTVSNVSSATVSLVMGQNVDGLTLRAVKPARIRGVAYYDENHSDAYDAGETLVAGLTLLLIDRNGAQVAELVTDEAGAFESADLIPGGYLLRASLDADCILVGGYQQSLEAWELPVSTQSGDVTGANFGVLRFGAIGGSFWSIDGSAKNVGGLTVTLYQEGMAAPIAQAVSGADGGFLFDRLYPGNYYLSAVLPEDHAFARSGDLSERNSVLLSDGNGRSEMIRLPMGQKLLNCDIGFGAKGAIGDFAWLDENGNGMQDIGERGVPGIKLELIQNGEVIAETTTDIYGHYSFEDIYPGKYTLRVTMHSELKATRHQTDFPLIGSVLPETEGTVAEATDVVVPSGARNLAVDIGLALRSPGVYPAVMNEIPTTDWSWGGKKNK
ncbi:MAG: carboxypeptidase regulatory-like domain-containing protein [Clostridia bacterium]|nr:carboxypeptidase regulatory-like domain-containing protein [Clostridia bacterium]